MEIKDFSNQRNFPGVVGNDFDVILKKYDAIQRIHPILFGILLLLLAYFASLFNPPKFIFLSGFYFLDWLLLGLLPVFKKSFGPPQPPVVLLVIFRSFFGWLPMEFGLPIQIIGTILVIYGFWIEPHHIKVTRKILHTEKLALDHSLRILHLGDLHIERISSRERNLNKLVKELKPDLILFSGDVLNLSYIEDPTAIQHAREVLSEWIAPLGSFGVLGSPAVDLRDIAPEFLEDLPLKMLRDEKITVPIGDDRIDILGLDCSHRPHWDAPKLEKLYNSNNSRFSILLYHSPDLAPNAAKLGIDLHLAGHTHGGQVCVPWYGALFTASLYGKVFEAGVYTIEKMVLYITRGIGMEGAGAPRVRFLCPPEIILWEIKSSTFNSLKSKEEKIV